MRCLFRRRCDNGLQILIKGLCWIWIWKSKDRKEFRSKKPNYSHYGEKYIYRGQVGNDIILKELSKNKPCLITRFGGIELEIVRNFFNNMHKPEVKYKEALKRRAKTNAGFFSNTDILLDRFAAETLNIIKDIDILCVWQFEECEKYIFNKYNNHAKCVDFSALHGFLNMENPWTSYLAGKKVLVLHPFEESIKSQYAKHINGGGDLLFKNPLALPKFDLKTIKVVQGIGGSKETDKFADWFEALNYMYEQIDKTDFDVALVAGGAYGMLLAHHIKELGKQAIHIGGALQLLFGIKGSRWKNLKAANEHWVFPSASETPKNLDEFVKTEGHTAYW